MSRTMHPQIRHWPRQVTDTQRQSTWLATEKSIYHFSWNTIYTVSKKHPRHFWL